MEKIELYKDIIQQELEYRQAIKISNAPTLSRHLIINKERTEFILIDVGWFKSRYISDVIFHIGVVNDKVWLHNDFTDIGIADYLVERGIPKSDIILAFLPKYAQELTDFAVEA
jgi:hypothetical protein